MDNNDTERTSARFEKRIILKVFRRKKLSVITAIDTFKTAFKKTIDSSKTNIIDGKKRTKKQDLCININFFPFKLTIRLPNPPAIE